MSPRRRGNLWARIERLETGTDIDQFRVRLAGGTLTAVPVDAALDLITGATPFATGPYAATLARITGTSEPAGLARSLVAMAAAAREAR